VVPHLRAAERQKNRVGSPISSFNVRREKGKNSAMVGVRLKRKIRREEEKGYVWLERTIAL
jgi:hypothetical protein